MENFYGSPLNQCGFAILVFCPHKNNNLPDFYNQSYRYMNNYYLPRISFAFNLILVCMPGVVMRLRM